jgi:transcriptional regulator with XRE-family HTH domain
MDDVRVGSVLRAVRIRRGLRQSDVARAAGVSQPLISQLERGDLGATSVKTLRRAATALGVSLPFAPRWRGADLPKLLDERHAGAVRHVVARLRQLGWVAVPEYTFNEWGENGSIDVLAWLPDARALLVVEVKTIVADLQDLLATLDRKRRLAPGLARGLGWNPLLFGALIVMPAETQARNAVARFAPVFDAAYPSRGTLVQRWLHSPERDIRGIWFLSISAGDPKHRSGGSMRVRPKRKAPAGAIPRSGRAVATQGVALTAAPRTGHPALDHPG